MIKLLMSSLVAAVSLNAQALTCSGVLDEVGVNSSGDVEVIADFLGGEAVRLCQESSVYAAHNLSAEMGYNHDGYANICKTWLSIAEISVATETPVKIEYASGDDCSSIPTGVSSVSPSKISIIKKDSSNAE